MNTPPGQQNPFFFPYRHSLTDGSMETENIESINVKEILQGQGMNDTQQGFYQPITGIYMQNGIPMNVTIPYNYMQGFPQVQGNPNTFNQQQLISSNDIQKSTMSLAKLRTDSIIKRDEQITQLGKEESDLITNVNTDEKEELKKEDENLDKRIEMLTKGAAELFKIYTEHIDKEESEMKDSENKESNSDEKKKPKKGKKESLQDGLEKSQKVLLKGITKLTKQSNERKKEISRDNEQKKKEITIRYSGKRSEVITNQQNDIISAIPQLMLSGTAHLEKTMLQQFGNAGQRINKIEGTINTLSESAKKVAEFTDNQFTSVQNERNQLFNQNTELRNINQQLNTDFTQLRMENQQLGNTISSQSTELTNLQQQNSEQQQRIRELENKNNELRNAIDENRNTIDNIMRGEKFPNSMRDIYFTALTGTTQQIGKEFIDYLRVYYPNVDKVNGLNVSQIVNAFYTQNINKYLFIPMNGTRESMIDVGNQLGFDENNFKIFIIEHLMNVFYSYMFILAGETLDKDPQNQNASDIRRQSDSSVNNKSTSESIINELRGMILNLFKEMRSQQQMPQQQMPNNPSGGFNNYNPFMSQPPQQGYSQQQQYVPQQNTSQFVNQPQTQYQQQTSNQPQNPQPEINIQQTAMPTGSTANLNNISKTSETNSNGFYTVKTKEYQFDKAALSKMLKEAQTILKNEGRTGFKLSDVIDRAFEINNINDEDGFLRSKINEIYNKPSQKK